MRLRSRTKTRIGGGENNEDMTKSQSAVSGRAFGGRKTKNMSKMIHMDFEEFVSNSKPSKKQPTEVYSISLVDRTKQTADVNRRKDCIHRPVRLRHGLILCALSVN
jgi:hypothetical protein